MTVPVKKGGPFVGSAFFFVFWQRPVPKRRTNGRNQFTGVGILTGPEFAPHLRRKPLTRFRESETPAMQ